MLFFMHFIDVQDYVGGMRAITIPPGVMTQSFIINVTDDNVVECSESFNVSIISVTGHGVTIGSVSNIEVILIDNDGK